MRKFIKIPRKRAPKDEVELLLVDDEDSQAELKVIAETQIQKEESEAAALVPTLEPAPVERGEARSQQPEVSEIIDIEEEFVDLEDAWGEKKRLPPMGWFVLLGLMILGLGAWATYSLFQAQPETEVKIIENKTFLKEQEKEKREVHEMHVGMQECVKGYLAATNIVELLPHVRFPERVEPLMQKYYPKHGRRNTVFRHFEQMRSVNIGKRSFVRVKVQLETGDSYHLLLEQLDKKTFKVDWESDVFYQPIPWLEYCKKRPLRPVDMRVRVSPDDFYGFAFRDKKKYQCYLITTLGTDRFLYGYVERGSEVALKLRDYFEKYEESIAPPSNAKEEKEMRDKVAKEGQVKKTVGKKGRAMILRIRFILEDESKFCVKIDDLVCVGWAYIESSDAGLIDLDFVKP